MDPWQRQACDYVRAVRPGALLRFVIDYLRRRGEIISRDSRGAELSMTWARPATREQVTRADESGLA